MNPSDETRTCPYCFETIKRQAIRCKHCQASLDCSPAVQAKDQATIGGAYGVTIGGQGFRIEGGIHYTLSELDTLDEDTKQQLRQAYEDKVRDFPELAQYHFALGLSYLDKKLYDLSTASLQRALGKTSKEADLLYYLTLACIGGRRPRALPLATIRKIESYLCGAIQLANTPAHYKILLALVKYDYYAGNGLRVPDPPISELLRETDRGNVDSREMEIMLRHVKIASDENLKLIKIFT
ncbi:MAG TPA: hypothetical protein VGP73_09500 [Thermoanaerobaculia bacterium]